MQINCKLSVTAWNYLLCTAKKSQAKTNYGLALE